MHVLAGVEIDKSGEAVSRMSNGALVAEFVHVIDVELIAKTTTLFMSRKYAELVTREALREEEIAEQQAVSQNKQVLLARIRAREAQ